MEFEPIISDSDQNKFVIEKIPPPPLHIKLGVVNHLVNVLEEEDPSGFSKFTKKYKIPLSSQANVTSNKSLKYKVLFQTQLKYEVLF